MYLATSLPTRTTPGNLQFTFWRAEMPVAKALRSCG